ncbi:hypothetical protein EMIHUDRAFT_237390 [Emiliania huxleyi CCMP1516]|uniref:Zinc finger C2H2 LYAR-type domain-containing protein n=2 Tax=Emiliania huxleyi TaxID=2903 RepID=A0A0D3JQ38_EMIH1|nr:hypothetical protein EMIHUDRAFT_237390 [Emiliania huxleyi CCMP1516]EOD25623.1 hypothetical protein EMIHUDRAFT_237390 [Emiliania huxleyi CCMP1516]|eukprot:XP_005778052.1 hypothetical protein EMIHUDRAFT_237390 [Emiliania huxleyi CCMP1516]
MVFFICETTNECIKKPKVEAHMRKHPNAWVFCCMDCGARFEGEAYKEHTSCMSEAQRYEGKFYVPKENKGEKKQQSWMESVLAALEAAPAASAGLKSYVDRLTQYDNLPRKKAKFVNFAKNSLNLKADREGIAEKLWALIEREEWGEPLASAGKKPVKWKKIVAKELTSAGGSMSLKALRKDCVAEVPPARPHASRLCTPHQRHDDE